MWKFVFGLRKKKETNKQDDNDSNKEKLEAQSAVIAFIMCEHIISRLVMCSHIWESVNHF